MSLPLALAYGLAGFALASLAAVAWHIRWKDRAIARNGFPVGDIWYDVRPAARFGSDGEVYAPHDDEEMFI